jgi:Protein of unknown function (DUF3277)
MASYSFLNLSVAIVGPNGSFIIGGEGAANAEEGCSFAMKEDKNTQTIGAGGEVMNSLHAGNAGRITVRLLKTSAVNALLAAMYNADRLASFVWGNNVISARDIASGDVYSCTSCAFVRLPNNSWAKDGGALEWEFDAGYMAANLAAGIPGITA